MRKRSPYIYYSADELTAVEQHYDKHFGPTSCVFHHKGNDAPHIDLCLISPTAEYPQYRLLTCGMGSQAMDIPDEIQGQVMSNIEVMITLPSDWTNNKRRRNNYWWPIVLLLSVAYFPFDNNDWLDSGHTISYDNFSEKSDIKMVFLASPRDYSHEAQFIELPSGKTIKILEMFPVLK